MRHLRLSPADTILFGIAIACLLFTLGYYLTGLQAEYRSGFAVEDGPVEWSTAICLFLASFVLLRNALRLAERAEATAAALTALYALVFFFGAGEEISWGQRLFGWEPGEFFRENNAQAETNIHNLVVGDVKLVNTLFGPILTLCVLLYLAGLPLLYTRSGFIRRVTDRLAVPVPAMRHTVLTLAASAIVVALPMIAKWESYELVFSVICVSIFLAPHNADRIT